MIWLRNTAKIVLTVTIILALLLNFTSCKQTASDTASGDKEQPEANQQIVEEKQTDEKEDTSTPKPTKKPLPKQLIYISVMGGRDFSLPIEEAGFDYNNFDVIIEFDPNDSTIKLIDIAWLMGIPVSEDETLPMMMMGDRFGPKALPAEIEKAFDLKFTDTIILNFDAMVAFLDSIGGVQTGVEQELIDDGSYNLAVDNLHYMAPNVKTPEKLDSAGEMLLTGSQLLALIYATPSRVANTPDGMDALIRATNLYIESKGSAWLVSFGAKLKQMSSDEVAAGMAAAKPKMYCSIPPDQYSEFAEMMVMCTQNDAQVLRMPSEAHEYTLEEGEFSTVMILDIEKARQIIKDFLAD